ncbi:hypothetical protein F2Q69_00028845 [Brassica cretica]|uniref:Uncharacterized protein n=1 Tax=Brassica cretica TaxID=69181 RepID=A0A8S9S283_BRACR|nr:hypothetical protein F2Q69_00028845 [Brassica cretica]
MFFRETKETEEDIRRMFHHVKERMKLRIILKKKSDPGKFAIPCVHAIVEQSTKHSTQNRSTLTLRHRSIPMGHRRPMNTIPRPSMGINRWADSGFHESFAVETVIPLSNEDPTEEYDEDYWKERAIEIAMQDERYSSHSFNNTSPPSIDRVYSASVDTHPHPAK